MQGHKPWQFPLLIQKWAPDYVLIETRWTFIKWHLKLVCGLWWCFLVCINVNTQVIALRHWRPAVHLNRLKQYLTFVVDKNMLQASRNITTVEQSNTFLCDSAVTFWKFHKSHVWLVKKYKVYLSESGNEFVKSGYMNEWMNTRNIFLYILISFLLKKMLQAGHKNEKTVHMHLPPLSWPPLYLFTQSVWVLNCSSV